MAATPKPPTPLVKMLEGAEDIDDAQTFFTGAVFGTMGSIIAMCGQVRDSEALVTNDSLRELLDDVLERAAELRDGSLALTQRKMST